MRTLDNLKRYANRFKRIYLVPEREAEILDNVKTVHEQVVSAQQQVNLVHEQGTRMQEHVTEVQEQITQVQGHITKVQEQVSQVREHVTFVQEEVTSGAVRQRVESLEHRIASVEQQVTSIAEQMKQNMIGIREALLALRYHTCVRPEEPLPPEAEIKEVVPISEQFDRLHKAAPLAYGVWRPILDVNRQAYAGFPIDSCSVPGHPMATLFRFFLTPYLKGRVLDIGCGPQPFPSYLEGHPIEASYGIDPVSEPDNHSFHFIKALAEYIPWADNQFNLVVAATSLDHVLLLDRALEEIFRVLRSDGIFAAWIGLVPGSKPYSPYGQEIENLDNFHLFHFDRGWFLDVIEAHFCIQEEFAVNTESVFFALRPKK